MLIQLSQKVVHLKKERLWKRGDGYLGEKESESDGERVPIDADVQQLSGAALCFAFCLLILMSPMSCRILPPDIQRDGTSVVVNMSGSPGPVEVLA